MGNLGDYQVEGYMSKRLVEKCNEDGIQMCLPAEKIIRIECNRCGYCCKQFTLPWSPERLKANFSAAQRGDMRYTYHDDSNIERSEEVNSMMAVWYPSLESIPIPEQIVSQMGESGSLFGLHWYSCRLLVFDGKDGLSSCSIHKNRPSVCSRFQPASQGGYIHDVGQILFPECAYRKGISERTQMLRDVSIETDQNSLKEEQQILVKLHEKISFGQELTELEKQFISSLSKKI